jgi:hypothetical protein
MASLEDRATEERLLCRIRGEYLEMPGLRLTQAQAQRLLALDAATCARVLESLVTAGFLQCGPDGQYGRIRDVTLGPVPVRMAKAESPAGDHDGRSSLRHARGRGVAR